MIEGRQSAPPPHRMARSMKSGKEMLEYMAERQRMARVGGGYQNAPTPSSKFDTVTKRVKTKSKQHENPEVCNIKLNIKNYFKVKSPPIVREPSVETCETPHDLRVNNLIVKSDSSQINIKRGTPVKTLLNCYIVTDRSRQAESAEDGKSHLQGSHTK